MREIFTNKVMAIYLIQAIDILLGFRVVAQGGQVVRRVEYVLQKL